MLAPLLSVMRSCGTVCCKPGVRHKMKKHWKDTLNMRSQENFGENVESCYIQTLSSSIIHKQRMLNCWLSMWISEALSDPIIPAPQIILTHLLISGMPPDILCKLFGLKLCLWLKNKRHPVLGFNNGLRTWPHGKNLCFNPTSITC